MPRFHENAKKWVDAMDLTEDDWKTLMEEDKSHLYSVNPTNYPTTNRETSPAHSSSSIRSNDYSSEVQYEVETENEV